MAMPQVHIVAYCVDLGYGTARGAEMLSIMTVCGIVSRLGSGWIADRIGGLKTLLLGSTAQAVALLGYLVSDGLVGLYVVSALFGLFQGGIIPSYGVIVREYFPSREAGARLGVILMATPGPSPGADPAASKNHPGVTTRPPNQNTSIRPPPRPPIMARTPPVSWATSRPRWCADAPRKRNARPTRLRRRRSLSTRAARPRRRRR